MTQADNERPRPNDARSQVVDPGGETSNAADRRQRNRWLVPAAIGLILVIVVFVIL